MNKHRVGTQVHPSGAAHEVGLAPGEDRCDAAVAYLVREKAIEPDEDASGYDITGTEDPFYRITPRGMAILSGYFPEWVSENVVGNSRGETAASLKGSISIHLLRSKTLRLPSLCVRILYVGLLEFIAALIGSVAWPLAIVLVVFILRVPLRERVRDISAIRGPGGTGVEFDRSIAETNEEVAEMVEEEPTNELPFLPEDVEERLRNTKQMLYEQAQSAPYDAVINAWLLVELETHNAAIRNNLDRSRRVTRTLSTLAARERIPEWVVDTVGELRRLRSEASRGREPVSPEAANNYIDTAALVMDRLARASLPISK
jgi:hypothetical protein